MLKELNFCKHTTLKNYAFQNYLLKGLIFIGLESIKGQLKRYWKIKSYKN